MPSHVKLFLGLTIAVVAYWMFSTALFWIRIGLPVVFYFDGLKNPATRLIMERNVEGLMFVTIPMCVAVLGTAWMAAFRHHNWARIAFVLLVAAREIGPPFYQAGSYAVKYYLQVHWARPAEYLPTILLLAASILIFTGNAQTWFRQRMPGQGV